MKRQILRDAALVGLAGLVAGIAQYLFLAYLGRELGPEDFGIFGVVISISMLVTVVLGVFNAIVIQYLSYFRAKSQKEKIAAFAKRTMYALFVAGIVAIVGVETFSSPIAAALNMTGPDAVMVVRMAGVLLLLWLVELGVQGILNGLQKFVPLAAIRVVRSVCLLGIGWGLVEAGMGVAGAMLGLMAASVALISLGFFNLRSDLFVRHIKLGRIGFWAYLSRAMPIAISLGVLLNVDFILVKYYLDPTQAGFFAAAAIIGGVLFFISDTVVKVMFPKVANQHSNGQDTLPFLRESFQYALPLTGVLAVLCVLFPADVGRTVFGSSYAIAPILPWIVLGMFFAGVSSILVMYQLAVRRFSVAFVVVSAALIKILLVVLFHRDILQVAEVSCAFQAALLVSLFALYRDTILEAFKRRRGYFKYEDILQLPQVRR